MDKRLILTLDLGTQSVRAVVYAPDGSVVARKRKLSRPYYSLQPGWAEISAGQFWEDTLEVLRATAEELGKNCERLAALTLACNRDAILPLDREGNALRDWIIWADQRRCPEALERMRREFRLIFPLIRLFGKEFFEFIVTASKFNWIREHEPDIYARTARFCTISSYLHWKLSGEFVDSVGMQVGVLPFEAARLDWYRIPQIFRIVGVAKEQLARLFQPGEPMAFLSREAAACTGLPEGLPLIAAGGDKQCETLGSGCFHEEQASISYGTMATLATTSKRYIADRKNRFYSFPSSIRGHWNPEFQIYRGYWLVTWFCRQYAQEGDLPRFLEEMNEEAAKIGPGANGLFVFPFWSPHRSLYPDGKGAIVGWEDRHRPADLYRAILESIAFALKEGLALIEAKSGVKVKELIITGGGSRSNAAMQLTADIFNLPCRRLKTDEVGTAGAAICAGSALGIFPSIEEAVRRLSQGEERFYPIPAQVEQYELIYKKNYLPFYRNNIRLFRRLRKYGSR